MMDCLIRLRHSKSVSVVCPLPRRESCESGKKFVYLRWPGGRLVQLSAATLEQCSPLSSMVFRPRLRRISRSCVEGCFDFEAYGKFENSRTVSFDPRIATMAAMPVSANDVHRDTAFLTHAPSLVPQETFASKFARTTVS